METSKDSASTTQSEKCITTSMRQPNKESRSAYQNTLSGSIVLSEDANTLETVGFIDMSGKVTETVMQVILADEVAASFTGATGLATRIISLGASAFSHFSSGSDYDRLDKNETTETPGEAFQTNDDTTCDTQAGIARARGEQSHGMIDSTGTHGSELGVHRAASSTGDGRSDATDVMTSIQSLHVANRLDMTEQIQPEAWMATPVHTVSEYSAARRLKLDSIAGTNVADLTYSDVTGHPAVHLAPGVVLAMRHKPSQLLTVTGRATWVAVETVADIHTLRSTAVHPPSGRTGGTTNASKTNVARLLLVSLVALRYCSYGAELPAELATGYTDAVDQLMRSQSNVRRNSAPRQCRSLNNVSATVRVIATMIAETAYRTAWTVTEAVALIGLWKLTGGRRRLGVSDSTTRALTKQSLPATIPTIVIHAIQAGYRTSTLDVSVPTNADECLALFAAVPKFVISETFKVAVAAAYGCSSNKVRCIWAMLGEYDWLRPYCCIGERPGTLDKTLGDLMCYLDPPFSAQAPLSMHTYGIVAHVLPRIEAVARSVVSSDHISKATLHHIASHTNGRIDFLIGEVLSYSQEVPDLLQCMLHPDYPYYVTSEYSYQLLVSLISRAMPMDLKRVLGRLGRPVATSNPHQSRDEHRTANSNDECEVTTTSTSAVQSWEERLRDYKLRRSSLRKVPPKRFTCRAAVCHKVSLARESVVERVYSVAVEAVEIQVIAATKHGLRTDIVEYSYHRPRKRRHAADGEDRT